MLIYCHVPKWNLGIAQETVICPNMTFDRLTFQLSISEEQLRKLYDIALSTLFSNPFGSVWVDLLSKLTLDLIDDLELNKMSHFRWIYVCVFICLKVLLFNLAT